MQFANHVLYDWLDAEQDEDLEKLAEVIGSTNRIAWAIKEEFRLLEGLDVSFLLIHLLLPFITFNFNQTLLRFLFIEIHQFSF